MHNAHYFIECKLDLLDAEKEWFYDPETKVLFLWASGGGEPNGDLRGKTQSKAIRFSHCNNLTLHRP